MNEFVCRNIMTGNRIGGFVHADCHTPRPVNEFWRDRCNRIDNKNPSEPGQAAKEIGDIIGGAAALK